MDDYNKQFYDYLKVIDEDLNQAIEHKLLTPLGIKSYLQHIPTRENNKGWDNKIYQLSDVMMQKIKLYIEKADGGKTLTFNTIDELKEHLASL